MKPKTRNNKKIIIAGCIAILIILMIIVIVVKVRKPKNNGVTNDENEQVFELPNTTYTGMEVTNIDMEYLTENDETMVSMIITNTSDRVVSDESLNALLLNDSGDVIGKTQTYIQSLDINEQYSISVILKGDLTSTTQISLQENNKTTENE